MPYYVHILWTLVSSFWDLGIAEFAHLRSKIAREVFDYQVLQDALSGYRKPRDKVTQLLACVFQAIPATDSVANRPLIPRQTGRPFLGADGA